MTLSPSEAIDQSVAKTYQRRDRRKVWEWCESNVVVDNTSPMPGPWRSDNSPWVREVMEAWGNDRIKNISVRCAAQTSKTQTLLGCLAWSIVEDPGPAMWVVAARDEAKPFIRERVAPMFENCSAVDELLLDDPPLEFVFTTMPLYFSGAGSPSKLQGKPIRWLILDEVRNYPKGAFDTVLKRTRAHWNCRRAVVSTPDVEDDAVDREYKAGDQRVWHFPCPKCEYWQPLVFEQLKWTRNEKTHPADGWNYDALAETIRYECVKCDHWIRDTPTERKHIGREGKFIPMNPNAPRDRVSFTWNALLPHWVPWRDIAEEFIRARRAARTGDRQPMKTFVTETLGEPWKDQLGEIDDFEHLQLRMQQYDYGEAWAEEQVRFMAADRQASGGEHYWWVVRAYGPNGKSRLIAYGRCESLRELEEARKQWNVPQRNAVVDSGFKAAETYRFCIATGWKAFKGDDAEFFLVLNEATKKPERRLWKKVWVDPALGKAGAHKSKLALFRFSNPGIKDLQAEYTSGLVGEWTLPHSISREYLKQISAECRIEVIDTFGRVKYKWQQRYRDNHLGDCELMLLVVACITGYSRGTLRTGEIMPIPVQ